MELIAKKVRLELNNKQKTYIENLFYYTRSIFNYGAMLFNNSKDNKISEKEIREKFNKRIEKDNHIYKVLSIESVNHAFKSINSAIKNASKKEIKLKKSYFKNSVFLTNNDFSIVRKNNSKYYFLKVRSLKNPIKFKEKLIYLNPLSVVISRLGNKYFASFLFSIKKEVLYSQKRELFTKTDRSLGVDLGIKNNYTLSNNFIVTSPETYNCYIEKIRKLQKKISYDKNELVKSNNNIKRVIKLQNVFYKVDSIKHDFLNKFTSVLIKTFDNICLENLEFRKFQSDKKYVKNFINNSFSLMHIKLKRKASRTNKRIYLANKYYASSKICSNCGRKKEYLELSERIYTCPRCGLVIDRDLNAAINLEKLINKNVGVVDAELKLRLQSKFESILLKNKIKFNCI